MTTAQDVFNITMAIIDEVLDTGLVSVPDTISYSAKTPGLLNMLQSELIKQGDLFSSYEVSCKPLTNLFGFITNFDIQEFIGTDLTFEAIGSAKAYYFEVDRVGTVYVEDYTGVWNILATVTTTYTPEGFTAYKGLVTPTAGATKTRLRFSGSYYYKTINRALFNVPFALAADIPDYKPWVKHTMPADFKSVNEIIDEYPDRQYAQDSTYKWEGKRDLYINYYYVGKVRIVYRPIPILITALTDSLQLDDVTCRTILPYGLAAHLLLTENPSSANFFNGRFEEFKTSASKQPPAATEEIKNVYGSF